MLVTGWANLRGGSPSLVKNKAWEKSQPSNWDESRQPRSSGGTKIQSRWGAPRGSFTVLTTPARLVED